MYYHEIYTASFCMPSRLLIFTMAGSQICLALDFWFIGRSLDMNYVSKFSRQCTMLSQASLLVIVRAEHEKISDFVQKWTTQLGRFCDFAQRTCDATRCAVDGNCVFTIHGYVGAGITVIGRLKHPPPESHAAKAHSGEHICFYTTMKFKLKETGRVLRFKAGDPMQGAFLLYLDGEEDQELAYARIHHIYKLTGTQVTFRWELDLLHEVCETAETTCVIL